MLGALAGAALARPAIAQLRPVRIGVLGDSTGMGAGSAGADTAVRLAIADSGGRADGRRIEIVSGAFRWRPDEALAVARDWFDAQGVGAIMDAPGLAAPAAVQRLAQERGRSVLNTGSAHPDLTGAACVPVATHWSDDMRAIAWALAAQAGRARWFLVATDTPFAAFVHREAVRAIEAVGGSVAGLSRRPEGARAFEGAMAQAEASGAAALGFCDPAPVLELQMRAARAAGWGRPGRIAAAFAAIPADARALGADADGFLVARGFHWNDTDATRAFAARFRDAAGALPDAPQAAAYVAARHWLAAVALGDETDGAAANLEMRRNWAWAFGRRIKLRYDGRAITDIAAYRLRGDGATGDPWADAEKVATIPGETAYALARRSGCPVPG